MSKRSFFEIESDDREYDADSEKSATKAQQLRQKVVAKLDFFKTGSDEQTAVACGKSSGPHQVLETNHSNKKHILEGPWPPN